MRKSAFLAFSRSFYSKRYADFAYKNRISRRVQIGISLDLLSISAFLLCVAAISVDYFDIIEYNTVVFKFINIAAVATFIVFVFDIIFINNTNADIDATAQALERAALSGHDSLGASTEVANAGPRANWSDPAFKERVLARVATTPEQAASLAEQEREKIEKQWQDWSFQGRKPELDGLPVSSENRKARP